MQIPFTLHARSLNSASTLHIAVSGPLMMISQTPNRGSHIRTNNTVEMFYKFA